MNIYNDKNQLTAAIEHVDGNIIANTHSYAEENVETITHNGFQYEFLYDEDSNLTDISGDSSFKISYKEDEEASTYSITYECGGVKKN